MKKRQLSHDKQIADSGKVSEKNSAAKKVKKLRYPLLTLILIIFLIQLVRGIIINSAKLYSFRTKIFKLEKINKVAQKKNQYLREELEKYTSNSGVEALARNRLQFSKEDETLVIIKNPQQKEENDE